MLEKVKYLAFLSTGDLRNDVNMYRQLRYVYGTTNRLRSKFFDCSKNVKNCFARLCIVSMAAVFGLLIDNLPFTVSG